MIKISLRNTALTKLCNHSNHNNRLNMLVHKINLVCSVSKCEKWKINHTTLVLCIIFKNNMYQGKSTIALHSIVRDSR